MTAIPGTMVAAPRAKEMYWVALLALGVTLSWAASWGAANLFALKASALSVQDPSTSGLGQAADYYRWALRLDPANPDYLHARGRLSERLADLVPTSGAEARGYNEEAIAFYRDATRLRPTWPYGQVAIVRVKAKIGAFDEEFDRALGRAADLGPWEHRVQAGILEAGLLAWDLLSGDQRDLVRSVLARALRTRPRWAVASAVKFHRESIVEPLIAGDERLTRMLHARLEAASRGDGD